MREQFRLQDRIRASGFRCSYGDIRALMTELNGMEMRMVLFYRKGRVNTFWDVYYSSFVQGSFSVAAKCKE